MPLALRDLQAAFAAYVVGADRADLVAEAVGDSVSAEARLRIHRHHIAHSLGSALAATFSTVHALVGDAFFRGMAQRFVGETPPAQPVLAEYGAGFPVFVAGYEPAASLPYLADIARLDWALNVAFHSPVSQGATLISSRYPLDRIWAAAQPGASADTVDLGDGGVDLLVLRRSDDAAFIVMTSGEAAFVAAIAEGRSVEGAAERALQADPTFDQSTAFARLPGLEAFAALQQERMEGV